jgi:hypothetical protein
MAGRSTKVTGDTVTVIRETQIARRAFTVISSRYGRKTSAGTTARPGDEREEEGCDASPGG